ncbi:MAG: MBL fold metallo-hydrolase [Methanomassiliicoccales archaeon]|nr:MBL fold metallo-hydrolase [Methanomassiliicoccales archaeon]
MNEINIKIKNGIEIYSDGQYYFDPTRLGPSGIYCISHAHVDHLPKEIRCPTAICTHLTANIAKKRLGREIMPVTCPQIRILNSGHVPGASMFLLENKHRILYTGDFNTRTRFGLNGATPVQTDAMVVESTYGDPRFIFPKTEEVVGEIRDWTEDSIRRGFSVIFFAQPLGKAQELISILSDQQIYVHNTISDLTHFVLDTPVHYSRLSNVPPSRPSIQIYPMRYFDSTFMGHRQVDQLKTAVVTGMAVDKAFRKSIKVDEAFPLSDHADFEELIDFINRCNPCIVLTHHGRSRRFSKAIKRILDIDSRPLIRNQTTVNDFL